MDKKYETVIDDFILYDNRITLYRIKALKDFNDVKAGDLGGYIESEKNLSHEGDAWIYDEAKVLNNAVVKRYAQVRDSAVISGFAKITDHVIVRDGAVVRNHAKIQGNAIVANNALVRDYASVSDNAVVTGFATVEGHAMILGNASILDQSQIDMNACVKDNAVIADRAYLTDGVVVKDRAIVKDNAVISGDTVIAGTDIIENENEYLTIKVNWHKKDCFTYVFASDMWTTIDFRGTSSQLIKRYAYWDEVRDKFQKLIEFVRSIK